MDRLKKQLKKRKDKANHKKVSTKALRIKLELSLKRRRYKENQKYREVIEDWEVKRLNGHILYMSINTKTKVKKNIKIMSMRKM